MSDEHQVLELSRNAHLDPFSRPPKEKESDKDSDEESCLAFGYLRGLRERALAVELRYRNGNRDWFPYSWLGPCRFNPSVGLLLKFTGDVVTMVLIRGSNLDALVNRGAVNLTDRGFQRHRITWVREMEEDELKKAGAGLPTIDRFEVAEFETPEEQQEWLKKVAPVFVRQEGATGAIARSGT
jgi:hypothetical protein